MQQDDNPITRLVEPVARLFAILFGYAILLYALGLSVEIVGRKLFNASFRGIDELGGFILAISASIGASYTMARKAHTRVDVFLIRMPEGLQRLLNMLAMVSMAAFAAFAAWRGSAVLADTIEFRSSSPNLQQPLWVPQALWLAGLMLFAVIACAYAVHALWLFAQGSRALNRHYGPLNVKAELDDELDALSQREALGQRQAQRQADHG